MDLLEAFTRSLARPFFSGEGEGDRSVEGDCLGEGYSEAEGGRFFCGLDLGFDLA